jgi:hypothetical protein
MPRDCGYSNEKISAMVASEGDVGRKGYSL